MSNQVSGIQMMERNVNEIENDSLSYNMDMLWSDEHEKILVEWADKAMCYRWLHTKEHRYYAKANALFTIPVIIMSTITGTANFAQDKIRQEYRDYLAMCIGSVNIAAGILTTIQQFLKISEYNEAHRVAAISWDKFYRNIKVELAKNPNERINVSQMLKHSKEEFDRLMETSPSISNNIIKEFKETFSDGLEDMKGMLPTELTSRQQAYLDLKKPEICDTIESTSKNVYKSKPCLTGYSNALSRGTSNTLAQIARKTLENKRKIEKIEKIDKIISTYLKIKNRLPTAQEIVNELDGMISIQFVETNLKEYIKNLNIIESSVDENTVLDAEDNV